MSYLKQIKRAIDFIEDGLRDEITLESISDVAGLSPFHFHRVFSAFAGERVANYVRQRRLTEAAKELRLSSRRILDIAIDFQFESQEAFTRAFNRMFGITPAAYRRNGSHLLSLEKSPLTMTELEHRQKGISFASEVVTLEATKFVGMRYKGSKSSADPFAKLWEQFDSISGSIPNRVNSREAFGLCRVANSMITDDLVEYLACVEVKNFVDYTQDFETIELPKRKYVRCTHHGPISLISATYDYIYGYWLERNGYELAAPFDIEVFDERFEYESKKSVFDLLIPIKPAKKGKMK